ncbi:MAG: DUF2191 domain-containing protein [Chloroflexi bacterium]|nr:DUF2191 domain-containing protein [Chloroflexota bacterium]
MRTTIRINDQLLREAKAHAALMGCSLTSVIEDALRQALSPQTASPRRDRITLTTVSGRGLRPGVDLDDSAKLLDMLEQVDVPD